MQNKQTNRMQDISDDNEDINKKIKGNGYALKDEESIIRYKTQ